MLRHSKVQHCVIRPARNADGSGPGAAADGDGAGKPVLLPVAYGSQPAVCAIRIASTRFLALSLVTTVDR